MRFALRLAGRITLVALIAGFISVVGLQYARIVGKNIALAQQLSGTQSDVRVLEAKRAEQDRSIRRLSDPAGAIPEIHDKLHLVRDREAIIYLKNHDDGP